MQKSNKDILWTSPWLLSIPGDYPALADEDEDDSLLLDSDHKIHFELERVGDVNDTCNDDKHSV